MTYQLKDWSLSFLSDDPHIPPEHRGMVLRGAVYGHPRFADGDRIHTSRVMAFDEATQTVTTRNSQYQLGNIDPDYERWCKENGHSLIKFVKGATA